MEQFEIDELQQLYEAEMNDQSAFARGRRALFDDNYEEAQQCFHQAVSENHAEAMAYLGYMYRKGLGVRRDDSKAAVLYLQAINTGGDTLLTSAAYNNLGVLFMKGEGVAQNLTKAKELFLQAINFDGSEDSKQHLSELLYKIGYEYQMDEEWGDAAKCYIEATEYGHVKAMEALGELYIGGWIGEDHEKGLMWLNKAAELGSADACFALGDYYYHGYGGKADKRLAKKWWQKAIERGHKGAARFYLKNF